MEAYPPAEHGIWDQPSAVQSSGTEGRREPNGEHSMGMHGSTGTRGRRLVRKDGRACPAGRRERRYPKEAYQATTCTGVNDGGHKARNERG